MRLPVTIPAFVSIRAGVYSATQRRRFMKWSGFAVLLIVPAALLMIWVAVLLESSGIMDFIRSISGRIMNIFRRFQ